MCFWYTFYTASFTEHNDQPRGDGVEAYCTSMIIRRILCVYIISLVGRWLGWNRPVAPFSQSYFSMIALILWYFLRNIYENVCIYLNACFWLYGEMSIGQHVDIALRSRITLDLPLVFFIWISVVRHINGRRYCLIRRRCLQLYSSILAQFVTDLVLLWIRTRPWRVFATRQYLFCRMSLLYSFFVVSTCIGRWWPPHFSHFLSSSEFWYWPSISSSSSSCLYGKANGNAVNHGLKKHMYSFHSASFDKGENDKENDGDDDDKGSYTLLRSYLFVLVAGL